MIKKALTPWHWRQTTIVKIPEPLQVFHIVVLYNDNKDSLLNNTFQAIMHHEGHMDDGLTLSRSQHEESRTARVIRSTVFLFHLFIRYMSHTKHPTWATAVAAVMKDVVVKVSTSIRVCSQLQVVQSFLCLMIHINSVMWAQETAYFSGNNSVSKLTLTWKSNSAHFVDFNQHNS